MLHNWIKIQRFLNYHNFLRFFLILQIKHFLFVYISDVFWPIVLHAVLRTPNKKTRLTDIEIGRMKKTYCRNRFTKC